MLIFLLFPMEVIITTGGDFGPRGIEIALALRRTVLSAFGEAGYPAEDLRAIKTMIEERFTEYATLLSERGVEQTTRMARFGGAAQRHIMAENVGTPCWRWSAGRLSLRRWRDSAV